MLSTGGRCVLPMLHLGSPVAFLDASKAGGLMALTSTGLLWHWDLLQHSAPSSCGTPSVATLLGSSLSGEGCELTCPQACDPAHAACRALLELYRLVRDPGQLQRVCYVAYGSHVPATWQLSNL